MALADDHHVNQTQELNSNCMADVIIVDTDLLDNTNQLFDLIQEHPAYFLMTGSHWPEEKQIDAILHAAAGYFDLSDPEKMLHKAIKHILQGDIWVHRHLVPKVIRSLIASKPNEASPKSEHPSAELLKTLSNREMEVANMISSGESNKQIAHSLNISERTVKAHLTSIFRKLNVPDRLHLAILLKENS